jgi:hypothetical protein
MGDNNTFPSPKPSRGRTNRESKEWQNCEIRKRERIEGQSLQSDAQPQSPMKFLNQEKYILVNYAEGFVLWT